MVAQTGGLAAVAFGLLSLTVHWTSGHRPGTAEALGALGFFEVHPAYLVAFGLGVGAVVASRRAFVDR